MSDGSKHSQPEPESSQPKSPAFKITLSVPIKWQRIANGEKVIWQTGPDECEVELVEGNDDAHARLRDLIKIFDDAERQMRRRRKVQIPSCPKTAGAKSQRMIEVE